MRVTVRFSKPLVLEDGAWRIEGTRHLIWDCTIAWQKTDGSGGTVVCFKDVSERPSINKDTRLLTLSWKLREIRAMYPLEFSRVLAVR